MSRTTRRTFLQTTTGLAAATYLARGDRAIAAPGSSPKKSVLVSMLPKDLSMMDRFKLAKEIGFEGTEVHTVTDQKQVAAAILKANATRALQLHRAGGRTPPRVRLDKVGGHRVDVADMRLDQREVLLIGSRGRRGKSDERDRRKRAREFRRESHVKAPGSVRHRGGVRPLNAY